MNGCNINALDNIFRTPLHWAACLGMKLTIVIGVDYLCYWHFEYKVFMWDYNVMGDYHHFDANSANLALVIRSPSQS